MTYNTPGVPSHRTSYQGWSPRSFGAYRPLCSIRIKLSCNSNDSVGIGFFLCLCCPYYIMSGNKQELCACLVLAVIPHLHTKLFLYPHIDVHLLGTSVCISFASRRWYLFFETFFIVDEFFTSSIFFVVVVKMND